MTKLWKKTFFSQQYSSWASTHLQIKSYSEDAEVYHFIRMRLLIFFFSIFSRKQTNKHLQKHTVKTFQHLISFLQDSL